MLEIERVDWSRLAHAYGEASDVPDLLRRLRSPESGERRGAFYDLYGTLYHQGSVYSATAAAVPFLVDIVADPDYPDRPDLLGFLGTACHGYEAALPAVRAALAEQAGRLAALLGDGDPAVRAGVLRVLSAPELRAVAGAVAAVSADPDPAVRAAVWLCLGDLDPARLPADCADTDPAVRLAWALAAAPAATATESAAAAPVSAGGPDRDRLAALLADLLDSRDVLNRLHGWTSAVTAETPLVRCADLISGDRGDRLLKALCLALVAETNDYRAMYLYKIVINAVFGQQRASPPDPVDLAHLDSRQRLVLTAIVYSDTAWVTNVAGSLRDHGLDLTFMDERADLAAAVITLRALVISPRQVPAAAAAAERLGRGQWLDNAFVFVNVFSRRMETDIPENEADFPPEVMRDGKSIMAVLWQAVRHQVRSPAVSWSFYPQLTVPTTEEIFTRIGYTLVPADPAPADPALVEAALVEAALVEAATDPVEDATVEVSDEVTPPSCVPHAQLPDVVAFCVPPRTGPVYAPRYVLRLAGLPAPSPDEC